ncbi:hypothetical protein [Bacteroides caecimuris]|uniref:hypothetical protein n=1 Tax=Bacteroides caecimuris TaxID=1796613 RepID=UPI001434C068|nr:hypothetical protein [Bacteroides caecimuris]GFI54206.1 hypothetical protein IMSAGC022_00818 [Alistipes sp.]
MTKENKSNLYFKIFVTKYKLIVLALILIPIVLGVACYFSVPFFNVAGSSAWLSFWGGYIGSTIMAGVTLYVLDRQLAQNHKENLCNAVMQIATLTNNEEKAQIDKLADALVDFQASFNFLAINQVAERMLNGQFLSSDQELLNALLRDVDIKSFKIDVLLKPIPESKFIKEYNETFNTLYNDYGLIIGDFIFFIDLMKDMPKNEELVKAYVHREVKNNKAIEENTFPNLSQIPGYNPPKSICDIIEENNYYENITSHANAIIRARLMQSINIDSHLKESLKTTIINLLDFEYRSINDNFNEKLKVYD